MLMLMLMLMLRLMLMLMLMLMNQMHSNICTNIHLSIYLAWLSCECFYLSSKEVSNDCVNEVDVKITGKEEDENIIFQGVSSKSRLDKVSSVFHFDTDYFMLPSSKYFSQNFKYFPQHSQYFLTNS